MENVNSKRATRSPGRFLTGTLSVFIIVFCVIASLIAQTEISPESTIKALKSLGAQFHGNTIFDSIENGTPQQIAEAFSLPPIFNELSHGRLDKKKQVTGNDFQSNHPNSASITFALPHQSPLRLGMSLSHERLFDRDGQINDYILVALGRIVAAHLDQRSDGLKSVILILRPAMIKTNAADTGSDTNDGDLLKERLAILGADKAKIELGVRVSNDDTWWIGLAPPQTDFMPRPE